jgi:N-acylneuraminate cytidylyltransferase
MTKKNIAIIPARGGSKRIPKKNIKDFLGKPIIAYSIETAARTNLFERIIVSTDSDERASVACEYGAETPFIRPGDISDDYTGTHKVIGHAVRWLENHNEHPDYVCCIYATAPLIHEDDIMVGYNLIKENKWDSIIAATNYSYPIYRSFKMLPNGGLEMIFPEHYNSRSQDLTEVYHDAGQFYWATPDIWTSEPKGYNKNSSIIKIPNHRVQDIDTIEDWTRAEIIYKTLRER